MTGGGHGLALGGTMVVHRGGGGVAVAATTVLVVMVLVAGGRALIMGLTPFLILGLALALLLVGTC